MVLKHLFNVFVLLCCVHLLSAQVYYVKAECSGSGASWVDASGDLSQILNTAAPGSQIWVATGTYFPVECAACTDIQRDESFEIPDSVEVYGGFLGTETELFQRDWENNKTTLSGDIDQDNLPFNNSKTIVHFTRVSGMTILDGFSIVDGYAHSPGGSTGERENSGAAIFNQGGLSGSSSHPRIRNCHFENNSALGYGGAVYNNAGFEGNASPVFENCYFGNNTSELGGGAIFNQTSFSGKAFPLFVDCIFENNSANLNGGGGVYNQAAENGECSPVFANCHFESNFTNDYGGGIYSHARKGKSNPIFEYCTFLNNEANFGGGVSNNGTVTGESNAVFNNCHFEDNHVSGDGAGVFNWGTEGTSNSNFLDCIFKNNNSDFAGAGIFNNGIDGECSTTLTNCKFIDNTATTYGGAVYNNGKRGNSNAVITNCLFQNNAGNSAGAVYNLGSENGNASPQITNCTFYGNTANVGAAIYNNASDSTGTSNAMVTNCIFWNNEANFGRVFRNILSSPVIRFSVVDEPDCTSMNSGIGSNVSCGDGILFNVYPEFQDTLNGDFRLKPSSPLLDLGDNTTIEATSVDFDLDHQVRIFNNIVDLGAYEYFEIYIPPTISSQPQDLTLCEGEMLSLSIIASGTPPLSYQWLKDGNLINNATSPDINVSPTIIGDSGDYVCTVMSAVGDTVYSETASVLINPILTPTITLDASDLEICENETVVFTGIALNEGDNPVFSWYLNNNQIAGDLNSIELNDLNNGDQIVVELISSLDCVQPVNAFDSVQISTDPLVNSSITIVGPDTTLCLGSEAVFSTSYINGGDNPTFQWFVNGLEIPGQNDEILIFSDLENSDIINCTLTSSEQCIVINPVVSNEIIAQVDSCLTGTSFMIANAQIQIYPNPSDGLVHIKTDGLSGIYTVSVVEITGHLLFNRIVNFDNDINNIDLKIPVSGMYFILEISNVNVW